MKKLHLSIGASALLVSLAFVGCGSSNNTSTNSSSTNTGTLSLNPNLANIDYNCGDGDKVTGENGEFTYADSANCTFKFGGITLNATPSQDLTVAKIAEENNNTSSDALAAYILAGTGYSDVDNLPTKVKIPDSFKHSTTSMKEFSSLDKFEKKLIENGDINQTIKDRIHKIKFDIKRKFANRVSVKFDEIKTPTSPDEKANQQAVSRVLVNGKVQNIGYKTILKTGVTNNSEVFGLVKDYTDTPITFDTDGSPYICNGTNDGVGSGLDYSSFLNKDGKIFMVSQFECQVGAMYMVELEQNSQTGELSAKDNTMKFISQKDEFGGFVHCAGQKTPWESHLGSEEYEPDARAVLRDANATTGLTKNKYYDEVAKFWKGDAKKMSPYYYGWTPEVKVDNSGNPTYTKHYSMGRMSHELSYVMPDNKTVYMSDDGTNVGLFMYIADKENDLSSGTLYAAKWNQTSNIGAGKADISWISLGHATDSEIRTYLDKDNNISSNDAITFTDIFDAVTPASDGTCDSGYKSVNTTNGNECLKIKDGMQKAASRLETRRYAAYMGATTEFRKEEGITFDKNTGRLYIAMSSIERGMENNKKADVNNSKYDIGGNNDIKLPYNKCGAVYALDVDTNSTDLNSSYIVKNMYSILEGTPTTYASDSLYAGNSCDVNGISNPDNVTFLEDSDILVIGEDTGKHENNIVWAYNTKTKELSRIFATPTGAETTSPFWYKDLKDGFGYLSVVTQHPSTNDKQSAIGYVGPFKNLTQLKESRTLTVNKLASYNTLKVGGTEIVAFDKKSKRVFTTNGAENKIDINLLNYNESNKSTTLSKVDSIDLSSYGTGVNSVAVYDGKVAVAVEKKDANKTHSKGSVVVFDINKTHIKTIEAGFLPDMVTFNEDGSQIVVANEGEPNVDYSVDPIGSIGVIDVNDNYKYTDITFNGVTIPNDVVLKANTEATKDLEPEYITVKDNKAYVTLQENNALAIVDLNSKKIDSVVALGFKDHSKEENSIDIEENGITELKTYKNLYGMYQPDSISSYKVNNKTYLVTANEGDGREYGDYENESKISKLSLDSEIAAVYTNDNDLKVNNELGKIGDSYSKLYAFGTRSFSIWDDKGILVFDSKNELAKLTSKFEPNLFNQDNGKKDGRSGNKGVEPEALTVGEIDGRVYAFVGLERQSSIVIYDITNPRNAKFIKYINTKTADISPEGMKFVKKEDSPTNEALLIVAFEISGSTIVYEVK